VASDFKYALRALWQNPGFALTAMLSIALAVGANSTIFSLANGLLLKPLSVPNPSEIVTIRMIGPAVSSSPVRGIFENSMSYRDFEDFRRNAHSFVGLAAMDHVVAAFAKDPNRPVQFRLGNQVDGNYFDTLNVNFQLGRGFQPDEDQPGGVPVIVLTHDLWLDEFAEDPSVVGRQVLLNNVTFTVVGVAPESFYGLDPFTRPDFFIPIASAEKFYAESQGLRTDRSRRAFVVKGRLKPGVSVAAAAQEAAVIANSLAELYPGTNRGFRATANTEVETKLAALPILGDLTAGLFTIALVILLIACANVANLMLSRGRVRAREIAVRLAVGASRGRLVRLLFIESLVIALAGGALAILAARFTAGLFSQIEVPSDLPFFLDTSVDQHVLWFTIAVSVGSALVFGLLPAFQSTRPDLVVVMKAGESDDARKNFFGRHTLVAIQIAGTMILVVLALQGRHNFNNLLTGNPGFRRDHRLTMRFDPTSAGYSTIQTQQFYERLVERAAQVPGIRSAAMTSGLPMTYDPQRREVVPEGFDFPPGKEAGRVLTFTVDDHYFDTLSVPILAGRGFRAADRPDAPRVVIVNEAFANEYLQPNPIGKRLHLKDPFRGTNDLAEVIGVTMTGKTILLTEPPLQVVYLPLAQNPHERMTLIAETVGEPSPMTAPLEAMVRSIDPNIPIFRVRTMEDIFDRSSVSTIRLILRIYDFAAAMGLTLALVGLYAVVAYQVARRTREIGIRMALGAARRQVVKIFLRQSISISVTGISIGLMLSDSANRLSASALGQSRLDVWLLAAAAVGLLLATSAASLIPAHFASRVDPLQALRQE
jgi:macrolide transport system ATP-binding/permease protein